MRNKLFILTLVVILPITMPAQVITGQVVSRDGKGIPFATVYVDGATQGVTTSTLGYFSIDLTPFDGDTLLVNSLGYETSKTMVAEINTEEPLIIQLELKTYKLEGGEVLANAATRLVEEAIDAIPDNYPTEPYLYNAFYRQHHVEDDRDVRLIEALVEVFDAGYSFTKSVNLRERIKVEHTRRSLVYERNGANHADHLQDMLFENPVHYRIGTLLNDQSLKYFHFEFDTADCSLLCEGTDRITYTYNHVGHPKMYWGTLWIDTKSLAVLRIEEYSAANNKYVPTSWDVSPDWKFQDGYKVVSYRMNEAGKYCLDSISFSYTHMVYPHDYSVNEFEVTEHFDFWTGEKQYPVDGNWADRTYKRMSNLYSRKYKYEPLIWEEHALVRKHPLNPEVINNFYRKLPLEQQFVNSGR